MSRKNDTPEVNNPERLAALKALNILDTPSEPYFDEIVEAAAALCDAPIALVSLVDDTRQWFKARVGLAIRETPVEQAVCAYTLDRNDLLIITDLADDPRAATNPLVTAPDGIRFYAGMPLRAKDLVLGSLCVIDREPRPEGLSEAQQRGLRALGRQVVSVLALRSRVIDREDALIVKEDARHLLNETVTGIDLAHNAASIGTFGLDIATGRIRMSDELRAIYGLTDDGDYKAADLEALIVPSDQGIQSNQKTRETGTAPLDVVYRIQRPSDGEIRSISRKAGFKYDAAGRVTHMYGAVQDITEAQAVTEELSHRLKNMLAMIMALATQTLRKIPDQTPVEAFQQRLIALGNAHDALVKKNWVSAPIREVVNGVIDALGQADRIDTNGNTLTLGPKATLGLSLVLHELTTNALKYGALSSTSGRVALQWDVDDLTTPTLNVNWREHDGPRVTPPTRRGFGTRLISMGLLGSGGATLDYDPAGLRASFVAPLLKAQSAA